MSTMFFLVLIVCSSTVIHGAIFGAQYKDVILPCSFKPEDKVVIHWITIDKRNVHSYYWNEEQLENQDKGYAGRTSLFVDEISKGNASLKIKNLKKSDENTYKCYVGKTDREEHEISLQVIGAILGEQKKDVTLPCSFKPGEEVVIHWTTSDNKNVHSYYSTADQPLHQDRDYAGRTSLFLNEISKGNASLQIKKLRKNDEDTYKCYVGTRAGNMENKTILQIIDLQYKMEYNRDDNGRLNLTCTVTAPSFEDIIIKWYENGENVQVDQSTHSTYPVRNNSLMYQCTVHHSIVQSSWTGTWTMKEPVQKKDESITCGGNVCEAEDNDCNIELNLSRETNEGLIAVMNNSLHNEDHNLNLPKLSAKDNGSYICTIKTEQKMTIEMTLVNITAEEEQSTNLSLIAIPIVLILVILCGIAYIYMRKRAFPSTRTCCNGYVHGRSGEH